MSASCCCVVRYVALWGVRKIPWVLLYVWVWTSMCGGEGVKNTYRGKAALFSRPPSSQKLLSKPGSGGQAVICFLWGSGRNRAELGRWQTGLQVGRDPRPSLLHGTPAKDRPPEPHCGDIFRNHSFSSWRGRGPLYFPRYRNSSHQIGVLEPSVVRGSSEIEGKILRILDRQENS